MDGTQTTNGIGLPADAVEIVRQEARKDGIFAGLTSGLASALIGQRLFGLKRNATLLCGVLSGVLSGILFTQLPVHYPAFSLSLSQAFRDSAMAKLRLDQARLRSQSQKSPETQAENLSI